MKVPNVADMTITALHQQYKTNALTPEALVDAILLACEEQKDNPIWITLLTKAQLKPYIDALKGKTIKDLPLYGIPFAIKDNIDLKGIPTTAACPEFEYTPTESAFVVQQLIDAGAIPIGKTNLDQFATGLVGTRSPYGACKNSINPKMISGGSSAGSAVAVGLGLVSFSLGTDTAGSGRVPAFLNNLVGLKPTVGTLSASGMIPACRTLDTISIFANTTSDAELIFHQAAIYDEKDDYARPFIPAEELTVSDVVIGVPQADQLEWFDNQESESLFQQAVSQFEMQGAKVSTIDFSPFKKAADLLYSGPWVAERYVALEEIIKNNPDALFPVTRHIISQAENYSAVDCFKAMYQLQAYKKQADAILNNVNCIVIPTAGTYYSIKQLESDPVQLNTNLGYYTNFMNLLDYSALAIPTGFYSNNMPFGITLFGQAFEDLELLAIAKKWEKQ